MKIILLTLAAAILSSCAPTPPSIRSAGSDPRVEVPAPQIQDYAKIPVGQVTPDGKTNTVISPYRPYNVIDVKGYKSGSIVGDPSTAKVNPATGKPEPNTSKYFRIP